MTTRDIIILSPLALAFVVAIVLLIREVRRAPTQADDDHPNWDKAVGKR